MSKKFTTRTRLDNAEYPVMYVLWKEEEDNRYTGKIEFWQSSQQVSCKGHEVILSQSTPLGFISVSVDNCKGGCWATANFGGVSITERDLQWAAAYASEALKNKHKVFPCKKEV